MTMTNRKLRAKNETLLASNRQKNAIIQKWRDRYHEACQQRDMALEELAKIKEV